MGLNNVIFVGPFLRTHRVLMMNRKALELRETGLVTSFFQLVTGQNMSLKLFRTCMYTHYCSKLFYGFTN